jgi:integrase
VEEQIAASVSPEPFVSADVAAAFVNLKPKYLLKLARAGILPAFPVGNGGRMIWRFRLSKIVAALESQRPPALVYETAETSYATQPANAVGRKRKGMSRFQRGWLRREKRKAGETWVLRWYRTRPTDGKRTEQTTAIGLIADIGKSESAAWREVQRLHLHEAINGPAHPSAPTFGELGSSYLRSELSRLAKTTAYCSKHNLDHYILPRWRDSVAADIKPLEIEAWFEHLRVGGLANSTVAKIRAIMMQVYRHAQRVGMISRANEVNPVNFVRAAGTTDYRPIVMSPQQALAIVNQLEQPERTLALLSAATGLRISESLGLKWSDLDFEGDQIYVRRTWTLGKVGSPKTKSSGEPVPMVNALAEAMKEWRMVTPYSGEEDWIFASFKKRGSQPREGGIAATDYLRPAAVRVGVLAAEYKGRFGWHNFRHSLGHYLVHQGTQPKVVQGILRHAKVQTTLDLYVHRAPAEALVAQKAMLDAMYAPAGMKPEMLSIEAA